MRNFFHKRIYLDYAATTPVDKDVLAAMLPYMSEKFGNAGSVHQEGVVAKRALDGAREKVARALSARAEEIIFTSGGTEANTLAIRGVVEALRKKGIEYKNMHIITSTIEHQSVLECVRRLEKDSVSVSYIGVDEGGRINPEDIIKALRPTTVLVSLMYVNNEIGTITPIRKIVRHLRAYCNKKEVVKKGIKMPLVHTDASQAPLFLDCSPERLAVNLLTVDAQKIYGPKGVGFLFRRHSVSLAPILDGGGQEGGLRSGTEPIALIVGLSEAFIKAKKNHKKMCKKVSNLRDKGIAMLCKLIPKIEMLGSLTERSANNINFTIRDIDMEFLVLQLDHAGVAVSTGSACDTKSQSSHVISALRGNKEIDITSIRISLGVETTNREIKRAVAAIASCVKEQIKQQDKK